MDEIISSKWLSFEIKARIIEVDVKTRCGVVLSKLLRDEWCVRDTNAAIFTDVGVFREAILSGC